MALQDDGELKRLQTRLADRAAVLRSEVDLVRSEDPAASEVRDPVGNVEDAGERGEQRARTAVRDVEQRRDQLELEAIAAALQRIDDGQYGECVDCGCDIPLARLQVQPAAARCVGCQERVEQATPPVPMAQWPGSGTRPG